MINLIEKALLHVLQPVIKPLDEALKAPGSLVIDGTLIPTWNWRSLGKTNFSGKHKRAGFNHQIICTLDGKLLVITDPVPGARDDAYAFKHHGLDQLLDSSTLADKGYIGLGLATPTRRSKTRKTPADVKAVNRFINSHRAVVERGKSSDEDLAGFAYGASAAVGGVLAGVFGGAGVDIFGGWGTLMNKPL